MDMELPTKSGDTINLLVIKKIQMIEIELIMGRHVVDLGINICRLTFPEHLWIRFLFDDVRYTPAYLFYDWLDFCFPLVFDFLKKRKRTGHF